MKGKHEIFTRSRAIAGLATLMLLGPAVAWSARTVGEEREVALARAESRAPDSSRARLVPPWEWTSAELGSLRDRVAGHEASAAPAVATPEPAPAPRPATPAPPPAALPASEASPADDPPEGFNRAEYLVREGNALWCQNRLPRARMVLVEARELLEPMAARKPAHPSVERTLALCKDLIDDIDSR